MNKFAILSLAMTMSLSAFAERIPVTEEVLSEIVSADALPHARVYLSDDLKIERETLNKTSDVDASINRVIKKDILKEKVGKNVKGKIIAIEGTLGEIIYRNGLDLYEKMKTLYVSFDRACESKECAFKFRLSGEENYHFDFYEGGWYSFIQMGPNYGLAHVPPVKGMDISGLKIGRLLGDKKLKGRGGLPYTVPTKRGSVELLIDLSELHETTVKKYKYGGH